MSVKPCSDCGRLIVLGQDRLGKWFALDQQAKAFNIVHGKIGAERGVMILHDSVCPVKLLKQAKDRPAEQNELPIQDDRRYGD